MVIKNKAFTLIELLITILIISVLCSLSLKVYSNSYKKQKTKIQKIQKISNHRIELFLDYNQPNSELEQRIDNNRLVYLGGKPSN